MWVRVTVTEAVGSFRRVGRIRKIRHGRANEPTTESNEAAVPWGFSIFRAMEARDQLQPKLQKTGIVCSVGVREGASSNAAWITR